MNKLKILNKRIDEKIELYSEKSRVWQLGYKNFGPLLLGFCLWINRKKSSFKCKNIHFLARDGYIVKKAYESIYGKDNTNKYFYLSRRSLSLPSMINLKTEKEILDNLILPPSFTIDDILKIFKIEMDKDKIESNYGIKYDTIFYRKNITNNTILQKIIKDNYVEIEKEIKKQNNLFREYMMQEEMSDSIFIVDIGWHCSIQKLLETIDKDASINGCYIGVYKNSKKLRENSNSFGFLYDLNVSNDYQYKTFSFVSLFESMFLSHEGTTLCYKKNNDGIAPVLNKYEYSNKTEMLNIIKEFQDGAIKFCCDQKDNLENYSEFSNEDFSKNLINMCMNPNKEELEIFGKLDFENFSNQNIINYNHSALFYYFHPKKLKEDFYKSGWRIVFLKKLFPFPFPHYLFFKLLCKIFL